MISTGWKVAGGITAAVLAIGGVGLAIASKRGSHGSDGIGGHDPVKPEVLGDRSIVAGDTVGGLVGQLFMFDRNGDGRLSHTVISRSSTLDAYRSAEIIRVPDADSLVHDFDDPSATYPPEYANGLSQSVGRAHATTISPMFVTVASGGSADPLTKSQIEGVLKAYAGPDEVFDAREAERAMVAFGSLIERTQSAESFGHGPEPLTLEKAANRARRS